MTNGNHVRVDPIQVVPVVSSSVTCLGVIWSNSLSPKESIAYNISKARRSFFASGISKRKLNHSALNRCLKYALFVFMAVKIGY